MFSKPINKIEYSDIINLVQDEKAQEGHYLDYKRDIEVSDSGKNKLIKHICGFANSGGGWILMGVDEETLSLTGIDKKIKNQKIDEWIDTIMIHNVTPRVFYQTKLVELPDNPEKVILILHIPESTKKPHFAVKVSKYFVYAYPHFLDHQTGSLRWIGYQVE